MRIGIPRALQYFQYFPLWTTFLRELGFETVVSPVTNKQILNWGIAHSVDGACLPLKTYLGHVQALVESGIQLIFVPQIISVARLEYLCPNSMGLPDIVNKQVPPSVTLVSPVINGKKGTKALVQSYLRFGLEFGSKREVQSALERAFQAQRRYDESLYIEPNSVPLERLNILLIGQRYLVDDPFISIDIKKRLESAGVNVFTAAQVSEKDIIKASSILPKRMFWTSGRNAVGALEHLWENLDGIVTLAAFACGADSLVGELIDRKARLGNLPNLMINLDEHTGEVGMITRLEAFLDLLERRRLHESDLSPHGKHIHTH